MMFDDDKAEVETEAAAEEVVATEDAAVDVAADAETGDADVSAEADVDVDAVADEAAAEGDDAPEEPQGPTEEELRAIVTKPAKDARYLATGKRKTSVARVIVTPGTGVFTINGRTLEEYFPRFGSRTAVMEPMTLVGAVGSWDVKARLHGGGASSQSGALRHGIAKALSEIHPGVRQQLKSRGLLKLDARQVERKKAGLKKARKRSQFSKR